MRVYETLMEELQAYDLGVFSKPEQERRIAICQSCPNYSGDETHNCSVCKCNINWKVLFTLNSCPTGKWTAPKQDVPE